MGVWASLRFVRDLQELFLTPRVCAAFRADPWCDGLGDASIATALREFCFIKQAARY